MRGRSALPVEDIDAVRAGVPHVLEVAEHDLGCATASPVPGLPWSAARRIEPQQLQQCRLRLPAAHSPLTSHLVALVEEYLHFRDSYTSATATRGYGSLCSGGGRGAAPDIRTNQIREKKEGALLRELKAHGSLKQLTEP